MLMGIDMDFYTKFDQTLRTLSAFLNQSLEIKADGPTIDLIVDSCEYIRACLDETRVARSEDYYCLRLKLCRNEMININYFLTILDVSRQEDLQIRKLRLLREIKALVRMMSVRVTNK